MSFIVGSIGTDVAYSFDEPARGSVSACRGAASSQSTLWKRKNVWEWEKLLGAERKL